jgi:hypothetical protein
MGLFFRYGEFHVGGKPDFCIFCEGVAHGPGFLYRHIHRSRVLAATGECDNGRENPEHQLILNRQVPPFVIPGTETRVPASAIISGVHTIKGKLKK